MTRSGAQAFAAPLFVAVVLHACVVASVWLARPEHAPATVLDERADVLLDLDLVERSAPRAEPTIEPRPAASDPTAAGPSQSSAGSARVGIAGRSEPSEPTFDADMGAVASGASDAGVVAIARPPEIGLGLAGAGERNPFLPRSEEAVERAESKRALDRSIKDAARARDSDLGVGPEGPVLSALASSTARSVAPVRGRAVFVATADSSGEVVSLELLDAEGGRPGWADAGRLAVADLRGKKLRAPPGTHRTVMRIEVRSAWKLPSGQDPGTDVSAFGGVSVAKGEGKQSGKVTLFDPIPRFRVDYVEVAPGVKLPLVSLTMPFLNMSSNVDPTNPGARPSRVIHTRVLESTSM